MECCLKLATYEDLCTIMHTHWYRTLTLGKGTQVKALGQLVKALGYLVKHSGTW